MMLRTGIILIPLLFLSIFGIIATCPAQGAEDTMCLPMHSVLKPPDGVEPARDLVEFPHAGHFTIDCNRCHHKWEGKGKIRNCMTSGCHDLAASPQKASDHATRIRYYKTAFHAQCIGCHRENKRKNAATIKSFRILKEKLPETGPTGCVDCH